MKRVKEAWYTKIMNYGTKEMVIDSIGGLLMFAGFIAIIVIFFGA